MGKYIDLTGKRFGKLVVIERAADHVKPDGHKIIVWKCQCDCGNIAYVFSQNLKNGTAKSCGCINRPDLTGQKFGRLTVIRREGRSNCNKATWLCECECGNQIIVTTGGLRSGNTKSCGCYRTDRSEEYWQENMIDLTGQIFGKLTVIKRSDVKDKRGQWKWLCKCECGNETLVTSSNLKRKNGIRSCGCTRHKDILGQRFGKLKVISKGKANGSWICQCDCGNTKEIYGNRLISGDIQSCGCKRHDGSLKRIDLTGKRFGRLTVLDRIDAPLNSSAKWRCLCDCGNEVIVRGNDIQNGRTLSCGCLALEVRTKHGHSSEKLYHVWCAMKQRCSNPKEVSYPNYGGRGIKVCEEWSGPNGFMNFYNWAMENGYKEGLSIDRIDVNGNYEPNNCRWITNREQQFNKRNNAFIEFEGERKTVTEWAEIKGIKPTTLYGRMKRGVPIEHLFDPVKK